MPDRPNRREFSALALALIAAGGRAVAQEPKGEKPAQELPKLESPAELEKVVLLPTLSTVPVRRGAPAFNVQMVDASLLPRDKQGIWVLDFAFKPLRMKTIDVPNKGRRHVHYLYYRVVNRTGEAREFVPQFTLVTEGGKRYEEAVLPQAVGLIRAREDASIPLLGAVDVSGVIPPSKKEGVDDAVFGVAMWDNVDPAADRMSIYVRGLSDGYQQVTPPDGGKAVTKYKTLKIDLIRRGDEHNLNEKEILLAEPAYEWVYW